LGSFVFCRVKPSHFVKRLGVGFEVRAVVLGLFFFSSSRGHSPSHTSLGQMEAVKATLPVHFRHGMQWQNVSYLESPTTRYLMRPHRQAPVRSRGAGGAGGAGVLMMGVCLRTTALHCTALMCCMAVDRSRICED
jgi:hypothetical protein